MLSLSSRRTIGRSVSLARVRSRDVVNPLSSVEHQQRHASSTSNGGGHQNNNSIPFRPRPRVLPWGTVDELRRGKKSPPRNPMKVDPTFAVDWDRQLRRRRDNNDNDVDNVFGPFGADVLRTVRRQTRHPVSLDDEVNERLRAVDYLIAEEGSYEDRVGERRGYAQAFSLSEAEHYRRDWERTIEEEAYKDIGLTEGKTFAGRADYSSDEESSEYDSDGLVEYPNKKAKQQKKLQHTSFDNDSDDSDDDDEDDDDIDSEDGVPTNYLSRNPDEDKRVPEMELDRNQLAFGPWGEHLIKVDRTTKLWRGGRIDSYRALVVAGNCNGCGSMAIGKAPTSVQAINRAARLTRKNIFFVDRCPGSGITSDLVGWQNSCKVVLRASSQPYLGGNPLIVEVLKLFGVANCRAKAYGTRTPYNVVRATVKALMTHESQECIAMKRGKRLIGIDRARRLQI